MLDADGPARDPALVSAMTLEEKRQKLDALARELGVYIWGCGCCESPLLSEFGTFPGMAIAMERVKIGEQPAPYYERHPKGTP